jgi:two-component system NtrC family sensor kinase
VNEDQLRDELEHLRLGGALALSNLKRAANLVQSFKRTSIDQSFDDLHDFFLLELINDVLFSLHHVLKRLPISIQVNCPQSLQLHGLPGVLDQILTNLVMNAVVHAFDHGKRAGHIIISAQTQETVAPWLYRRRRGHASAKRGAPV